MLEKESRRIYIKLPIVAFSNLENMDNFFLLNIRAKEKKKRPMDPLSKDCLASWIKRQRIFKLYQK